MTERGKQILHNVPAGRYGKPQEVVGAALWLVSESASFVTGAVIPVDGGYTALFGSVNCRSVWCLVFGIWYLAPGSLKEPHETQNSKQEELFMKALVLEEYNQFVYKDMPEPEIASNEVLIQVKACGICGSDVHGMDGSSGRRIPPLIMGHEASGVIVKTGSHIRNFSEGDRVTFDSTIYCGQCFYCRQGQINLCDHRRVLGVSPVEYRQHGAFAEYVAVPEHILYRLSGAPLFSACRDGGTRFYCRSRSRVDADFLG